MNNSQFKGSGQPEPEPKRVNVRPVRSKAPKLAKAAISKNSSVTELVTDRLGGFSLRILSWAVAIALTGFIWFMFYNIKTEPTHGIADYSLQTKWFPEFTISVALGMLIAAIVKMLFNIKQLQRDLLDPDAFCYYLLMPVIVILFGEVLQWATPDNIKTPLGYAGITFYAIGMIWFISGLVWFIYLVIRNVKINMKSYSYFIGSWMIPLTCIGVGAFVPGTIVTAAVAYVWIVWAVSFLFGAFGFIINAYRYLILRNDINEIEQAGFLSLPFAIWLMGFANITWFKNLLSSSLQQDFGFVLLGILSAWLIIIYILMFKTLQLGTPSGKWRFSQGVNDQVMAMCFIGLATATFANMVSYTPMGKGVAEYVLVQISLLSVMLLYTAVANTSQIVYRFLNRPQFLDTIDNKFLRAYF